VRAGRGLVPTPYAAALRDRVHELTRDVQAIFRPKTGCLEISDFELTLTIRANEAFVEFFPPDRPHGAAGPVRDHRQAAVHHHRYRALVRGRQFPRDPTEGHKTGPTRFGLCDASTADAREGLVDSPSGGVAPGEGATFLDLPHVPRGLNWVRIAQRFPVRVLLQNPSASLMRIRATASIVIER
jgi:hypothetical protein